MRTILFFYIIVLSFGCGSYPKDYRAVDGEILQPSDPDCSVLFAEIKEKWAVHKEDGCYYHNEKLMKKIIANKHCFIGEKMDDVYKLLGEPSSTSLHNYDYTMSNKCDNKDTYNNKYYHLKFVAIDTVGDVKYIPIVWID